jgi:salicylate hydroxylase
MIANTDCSLIMGIPAYDRDPVLPKKNVLNNVVLLGDAAHPMSPFKGQGANQALLDAVSFVKCLTKANNLNEAIASYELEMMNRVSNKVIHSRERVPLFHDANILNSESFEYRGSSNELINLLKANNVNYNSGEELEYLIKQQMKSLNLI